MSQAGKSIKDISTATKAVSGISTAISIDGVINTDAIKQYRTALAGLSAEQQALVLSSAGLNAEQANMILTATDAGLAETALSEAEAKRVLAEAGLVSSTATLTAQEITSLATKTGLTEVELQNAIAEAGAITTKEGDVIVTEELNAVELKQALISRGVEEANAAETASFIAETTAKKAASTATVTYAGTSNLLVGALSKLKAVIATHPILTFAAILGAGVSAIYKYKKSIDDLIESAKNITDEYESTSSKLHKDASTMESLSEQYVKLSKGVNSLGENVNLTTDEYEQYKTIVNQIAELSPNLIKGYSDEGDAILKVKDNVKELTDAYNDNIIAANNSAKAQSKTIIDAAHKERVKYNAKDTGEYQVQGLEDYLNGNIETWELLSRFNNPYAGGLGGYQYKDLTKLLDELGIDPGFSKDDEFYTSTKESEEFTAKLKTTLENLSTDQRDMLQGYVDRRNSEFEDIFKGERDVLKAHIENSLLTDKDLEKLPDSIKTTLLNLSDSLDVDVFKTFGTPEEMFKYANQITNTFKNLTDEQKETFEIGVNLETLWNNNELSYDEYKAKVEAFYNLLRTLFPDNENIITTFQVMFDMPDEKDFEEQENLFQNRIKKVKSKNNSDQLLSSTPTGRDVLGSNFTSNDREFQQWADRQSQSVREQLYNISDKDLEVGLSFKTDLERDAWLTDLLKTGETTVEVELEPNASDLVSDLKDIEDAFGGLGEIESAGTSSSASDIEQVNSDMGGVTFGKYGDGTSIEDVNAMSSALEKYNKVLTDNKSTTEDVDKATDDLVTAYLDLSGKLDNVTEATKDKTIEELKSYGIENAEEVVTTRLNKVYKNFSKNLQSLSKKVAEYHDTLEEGLDAEHFEEAASDIAKTVKEMFTVTDDSGQEIAPTIDTSFIEKNLEDIKLAAEGDIDAIARLRVEAAKTIDVDVNVNDDELYSAWSNVSNAIANLDGTQFVIGGYMDDSEIIAALNEVLTTGRYTVSKFKEMVSEISGGSISAEVQWETKTVDLPTPQFSFADWKSNGGGAITSNNRWKWETTKVNYSMPKFQYKWNGGTGSSANYNSPSSSDSNSGSTPSDSSSTANKKTEDDKEVYDWIEKYLDKLEDDLDKLTDKVNDTYDNWENRNKSVGDSIANITKQIKDNKTAQEHYLTYANKLKVNNGETKVDDDDYGDNDTEQKTYDQSQLDAANKIWNGKEGENYKKLIQEGKLGKNDIETIQNKYLKDVLSEYETWWNKAKEAGDKAISLTYDLKSKYQDLFNNVKDNYDEMIDLIEKRTSLVEKNINRMQEEGHFVNKKYYDQQLKLNAEVEAKQRDELADLRKQYNTAITTGGIDKNSEAARSMLSDIYDKAGELQDTLTEAITIRNNIRQLGWDKFDWLEERMARINAEAEHFQNILSHYKQVDDLGNFTDEGWANLSMDYAKYESDQKALERYKQEYESLKKELKNDETDQDVIQRMEAVQDEIWKLEESSLDSIENMKSKLNEAFDQNLAHLSETINKYKEALQDAKDLFSYQKNIESQTNNIMKLEKQLAAYRGDTSEAGRKKQVELQQKYKDAQEQLKETEWDKYISETGELLDDLYEDYEEFLSNYLDNFQNILGDVKTALQNNPTSIAEAMSTKLSEWDKENGNLGKTISNMATTISGLNTSISSALSTALAEAQKSAKEGNTSKNEAGTVTIEIDEKTGTIKIVTKKDTTPTVTGNGGASGGSGNGNQGTQGTLANLDGSGSTAIDTQNVKSNPTPESTKEAEEEANRQLKKIKQAEAEEAAAKEAAQKKERANKWIDGIFYDSKGDVKYKGGAWRQDDNGWWYRYTKDGKEAWLAGATHTIDGVKYTFNSDGYWNSGSVTAVPTGISGTFVSATKKKTTTKTTKKKAKGDKHIPYSDIYETNEADTGSELIYKTSSGGILTPLDAGDMVFNHEMSQRLWDIAANNIPTGGTIQMVNLPSGLSTGTVNVNAEATFNLPNVTNYDEFKNGLQNDNGFEKFIKEITVGQLHGNNSLNKRKY